MKKIKYIAVLGIALFAASCQGYYKNVTVSTAKSEKTGEATKRVWFGLAMKVDVSIATAAKNGGITKISTVDMIAKPGFLNMLYITRVSGE